MENKIIRWIIHKDVNNYLKKITPKRASNLKKKGIWVIMDIIFGLIVWQKCFLNTIVQNMQHYLDCLAEYKKGLRKKSLSKPAQIGKISDYLENNLKAFQSSFLTYIFSNIIAFSFEDLRWKTIKERVYHQLLCIHDTTDIQKPFAKKMEDVWKTRDGSKKVNGRGYYAEWSMIQYQEKFFPVAFNLFSPNDTKYITDTKNADSKEVCKENMSLLSSYMVMRVMIHLLDRWYDESRFIKSLVVSNELFVIRWVKSKSVIDKEYYHQIINRCPTQLDKKNIFSTLEVYAQSMSFLRHKDYRWFTISWKEVYRKWHDYLDDTRDIVPITLIVVNIIDPKVVWINEDLDQTPKEDDEDQPERVLYFYTNVPVKTIDDAIVLFLLYFKRRAIETWFKYLKQVFKLEGICMIWFTKLKNLCDLLVPATYYLYDRYFQVKDCMPVHDNKSLKSQEAKQGIENVQSLERAIWNQGQAIDNEPSQEVAPKNQEHIIPSGVIAFMYSLYIQYCRQTNLTINPQSFAKFINHTVGDLIVYTNVGGVKFTCDTW